MLDLSEEEIRKLLQKKHNEWVNLKTGYNSFELGYLKGYLDALRRVLGED